MHTDEMIQLIQNYPSLWDKGCEEYKDRAIKEKCWTEVTMILTEERWEELSSAEKQRKIADVKLKWKHVRDHFRKTTLQGPKSGASAKKSKYMYADLLQFLLSPSEQRGTSGDISFKKEEEEEEDELKADPEDISSSQRPTSSTSTSTWPRKTNLPEFQSHDLKTVEKPRLQSEIEPENSNKLFLMSILPFMDKLSDDDNLEFRQYLNDFFIQLRRRRKVPLPPI